MDASKWVGVVVAAASVLISLLVTLYKGAMWMGELDAKVAANSHQLSQRPPYVDELHQLRSQVEEVRRPNYLDEIRRLKSQVDEMKAYEIDGISTDLAKLEERVDAFISTLPHYKRGGKGKRH